MPWHVITREPDGLEGRSSAFGSEDRALGFACDLLAAGVAVARIEGDGVEIGAEEIAERCTARTKPRRMSPRQ